MSLKEFIELEFEIPSYITYPYGDNEQRGPFLVNFINFRSSPRSCIRTTCMHTPVHTITDGSPPTVRLPGTHWTNKLTERENAIEQLMHRTMSTEP